MKNIEKYSVVTKQPRFIALFQRGYIFVMLCYGIVSTVCCFGQDTDSERHAFIRIQSSNAIWAVVMAETNLSGGHGEIHMYPPRFYNEQDFGERWILEGWTDIGNKTVLYDTHAFFAEKEARENKLRAEAVRMSIDDLKRLSNSTNIEDRKYADELWKVRKDRWMLPGGGSRRSIERARDVSRGKKKENLVYKIPSTINDMIKSKKVSIRYIQLRIEPVGTNPMPVLLSNILDLQEPLSTNRPNIER